ncbi:MAG: hypothetical protein GY953_33090, partial [bacterium]|nr:hypothetical protein [bacterium]
PERATHYLASIEQRLNTRTRVRVEFYSRDDRDLLFRDIDPRMIGGRVYRPPDSTPVLNSIRGYARGFEVFLQRRTANRLTGWISYGYGRTGLRDGASGQRFGSDFDQRHTVNVYGSYRLRPTVNLSSRYLYGSGFPIPGYLRRDGELYFLSQHRNRIGLNPYHRLDFRINKAFVYRRWKLTLYAEVVNLFNRANHRYEKLSGYNGRTGRAFPRFNKLFPILPSAGLLIEFGGG